MKYLTCFDWLLLLEPEKTFLVHACCKQCISTSCIGSTNCFINKKKRIVTEAVFLFLSLHAWDILYAYKHSLRIQRTHAYKECILYAYNILYAYKVLCFLFSHCSNKSSCISQISLNLPYLIFSLVYILGTGFSWTSTCPCYSYSLASKALAEATANITSRAQTTPEGAGVI